MLTDNFQASMSVRRYCYTLNNPNDASFKTVYDISNNQEVSFHVWQLEKSATGTVHIQGGFQYSKKLSIRQVMAMTSGEVYYGHELWPIRIPLEEEEREDTPMTDEDEVQQLQRADTVIIED